MAKRTADADMIFLVPGRMFVACLLLGAAAASLGETPPRAPVVVTPHFALYSDFDTNLNDALVEAGRLRKDGKPELFRAGDDGACFDQLDASARAGWNRAVDYYAEIVSPDGWTGRKQYLIRVQLAGFDEELKTERAQRAVQIAQGFRAAAAPAYRACRWTSQDQSNRRWIAELAPKLAADEERTASRLERLYEKRWTRLPIPVDVVQTVSWAGANSIIRDGGGGHILVSCETQIDVGLETVFHEASHLLMDRGDPVRLALETAAARAGYSLPRDLWHVVLFYTTGEGVRDVLEASGTSKYTPMLSGMFDRGDWASYRGPLETAWRPYVEGKKTLPEAAAALVLDLNERSPAR
jgi:hypothetical protein